MNNTNIMTEIHGREILKKPVKILKRKKLLRARRYYLV
jgi:ribosomal protein S21